MPPPSASRRTLLAAGAAGAAALAWPARAGAQGTGGAAAGPELRFGALFPLSGALALLGDECFRGLEMATEARNAAGGLLGRPVRLLRTDVTEPAQAQAEARRLTNSATPAEGRAVALFGTLDTQLALAASQAAELAGVPYLELAAAGDALTERGFRLLFRACPPASELARAAVEAVPPLAALLGAGEAAALRLAVLHEDGPGPQALAAALEARIREAGLAPVERVAYVAPPAAPEIAAAVRRLRSAGAQAVLHAGGRGTDAVPFFRALAEEGWRPGAVVGLGGGYPLRETAQAIGPAFEGTLLADLPQPEIAERFAPGAAAFAEAYRHRYGAEMRSGHSLACWAGALLFYDAMQRAGAADPARVRAAVLGTDVPAGGLPNGWGARFDERGQNKRAGAVVLQWREGRLLTVLPAEAAAAPMAPPRPP